MINLYPLNDLVVMVALQDVDTQTGKLVPDTTGPVSAFLATSILPTAAAADPTLTATCMHVGKGQWLIMFDASILTYTLLNNLFAATSPYIIIVQQNDTRSYVPLAYVPSRPATVVSK